MLNWSLLLSNNRQSILVRIEVLLFIITYRWVGIFIVFINFFLLLSNLMVLVISYNLHIWMLLILTLALLVIYHIWIFLTVRFIAFDLLVLMSDDLFRMVISKLLCSEHHHVVFIQWFFVVGVAVHVIYNSILFFLLFLILFIIFLTKLYGFISFCITLTWNIQIKLFFLTSFIFFHVVGWKSRWASTVVAAWDVIWFSWIVWFEIFNLVSIFFISNATLIKLSVILILG